MRSLLRLPLALLLALAATTGAHAQSKPSDPSETAILPIWNNASGKVEAALYLEPTDAATGARWHFGKYSLDTVVGLGGGDSLALLCDRKTGISSAIGSLTENCFVGSLGDNYDSQNKRANVGAVLNRGGTRFGLTGGTGKDTLPGWLMNNAASGGARLEQNDLTLFAEKSIGRNGVVSIGGTTAKARLVPAADLPAGLTDRWNTKSLSVGGGVGAFSANIIGRVVDVPGRSGKWEGLGLGVTWRTPWSGQLTVGAENVVTRGKNPFSPNNAASGEDDGTVPYVRYEQDL